VHAGSDGPSARGAPAAGGVPPSREVAATLMTAAIEAQTRTALEVAEETPELLHPKTGLALRALPQSA